MKTVYKEPLSPNGPRFCAIWTWPVIVLGDPAYPHGVWRPILRQWDFSSDKQNFHHRLRHGHIAVEYWYGRLKWKWQCLLKRLMLVVPHASCVWHNLCKMHGDNFSIDYNYSTGGGLATALEQVTTLRVIELDKCLYLLPERKRHISAML